MNFTLNEARTDPFTISFKFQMERCVFDQRISGIISTDSASRCYQVSLPLSVVDRFDFAIPTIVVV